MEALKRLTLFLLWGALVTGLPGCSPAAKQPESTHETPQAAPVVRAVEMADAAAVREEVAGGADVNQKNASGEALIVIAAKKGYVDVVSELAAGRLDKVDVEWSLSEALKLGNGDMLTRLSLIASDIGADGRRVFANFPIVKAAYHPSLCDADVRSLVVRGRFRHLDVAFINAQGDGAVEIDGMEYQYLPREYDTYEKMLAYLRETYSAGVARQLAERYRYKMVNGRYVEMAKGLGLPWDWENMRCRLVFESKDGNARRYIFFVPGYQGGFLLQTADLILESAGWRLNSVIEP